jgi:Resolvase, N terminal domain/Phage capsid family
MDQSKVRALVGARVSNVQGDEKTSHITQRGKGEAYAESQGWTVVGAFEDLDVSAIKLSPWQRPDLKAWLTDQAGEWDALIFAKTNRVFRSAADCVKLAEWCREHHKILILVDDGIRLDYYHPEDAKDAFAGAMSVFVLAPDVALTLSKAKQLDTGSNVGLLDATGVADGTTLAGVPVLVSTDVAAGNAWGLDSSQVVVVQRTGTQITRSVDAAFDYDAVQVRGTARISWGFSNPAGVVRLYDAA